MSTTMPSNSVGVVSERSYLSRLFYSRNTVPAIPISLCEQKLMISRCSVFCPVPDIRMNVATQYMRWGP